MTTDAAASGARPTAAPGQFTRASSGLVRQLSIRDTAWYGIISAGVTFGFFLLFPLPQAASPGINVLGTCALAFLVAVPIYFVYAAFGSAMPRAGGDYVYESRTIGPFLGFVVPMTCQVIAFLPFIVSAALVAAQSGIAPILDTIGLHGLASDIATTKTGEFLSVVVLTALMYAINVLGLHVYRRIQRYVMIPMIVLSVGTIYVLLLVNLGTSFPGHFNSYSAPLTAQEVHQQAVAAGYHASGYSLRDTVIWVTPLLALVPFAMFAAMGLLGEVRSANNLGRLFRSFVIPGFVVAIVILGVPYLLLQHIAGRGFLTEFAVALNAGNITPSFAPSVQAFLAMLSDSAPVTILIALGFIVGGFGFANTIFVNISRIMMAMGLERSLPNVFGQVSPRFHTPVKNLTLYAVLSLGVSAVYIYDPSYGLTLIISTTVLSAVIIAITSFSAALFPFRAREIYEASPISRWRIGSVPLITIAGGFGAVVVAVFVYLALTESALGLTSSDARITMAVELGIALLVFGANRLLQQARGFDPSLAARTIPPD